VDGGGGNAVAMIQDEGVSALTMQDRAIVSMAHVV